MIRPRAARRGLALIEVIVAIVIILLMSIAAFSILQDTIVTRDVLAERDAVTRAARVVTSKLRRELQLAYLTEHIEAVNTYQTVFVGIDDNPDRLVFTTLSHQRLYRDSRECDQTEVTWWLEDAPKGPGYTLYHREGPRIDEEPDKEGVIFPLAENVRTFDVHYLDSRTNEWIDAWDTRGVDQANRLPRAVRVGLVIAVEVEDGGDKRTIDVPVLTTIDLHYAEPLQQTPLQDMTQEEQ